MKSHKNLSSLSSFQNPNEKGIVQNRDYLREYIQCILLAAIFFLLVSVITYNPMDSSYFNINSSQLNVNYKVTNTFGLIGANLADWMYQLFGIGSVTFLCVFFIQILGTFKEPKEYNRFYLKIFGYPQLILCYLCLSTAIIKSIHFRGVEIYTGGFIGYKTLTFFQIYLGKKGAFIAFSVGFLSSLTLAVGIRPITSVVWLISLIPFKRAKEIANSVDEISNEKVLQKKKSVIENEIKPNLEVEYKEPLAHEVVVKKSEDLYVKNNTFDLLLSHLEYYKNDASIRNSDLEEKKLIQEARLIEEKLLTFGVNGKVTKSVSGPVIHIHEFEPASGVKVNKIFVLQDDLALALKAQSLRICLQPGKNTLSIEVPGFHREIISLRELLEHPNFVHCGDSLPMALGKNTDGSPLIADLCHMPHLLVAGATGSGKSVCINTMLLSLLISKTPKQLRLILIDPKMLELSNYNGIGHLLMPVVTEPEKATGALKWAIQEMERRYLILKNAQVRNIAAYNAEASELLPYIVIIIDELCDLMMTAPKDVEESIQRLAQKARAAGIHLILATQRPSVDVLTGVIKANLPCRLSFQVASRHDSRTIIENIGAERLIGKGDMLFLPPGLSKVTRAQCAFVNDKEINSVSDKLRSLYPAFYENDIMKDIERVSSDIKQRKDKVNPSNSSLTQEENNCYDDHSLYEMSIDFAVEHGAVSTSSLQREFRIGYNRAARVMDRLIKEGFVGPSESPGKPRPVIRTKG
jgi:S-DNA-T family DNA segregation ATPase FtsK/SpoIIIE